jgi:hypothetical protein
MIQIIRFFKSIPKSIRIAKKCKGDKCLNCFETHIWRIYKLEIEPKIYDTNLSR